MVKLSSIFLFLLELLTALLGWTAIVDSAQQCRYREITLPGLLEFARNNQYIFLLVPIFGLVASIYGSMNGKLTKENAILLNQIRITVLLLVFLLAISIALLPWMKVFELLGE